MSSTFETLGLRPELMRAAVELGFETATPIQRDAIPVLLEGRDVIGQAQTGTGKTAAFGLPLLQRLDTTQEGVQALILTPTRELALQVSEALQSYGRFLGVRVLAIYGGQSYGRQKKQLAGGSHIVVGTPGRTLDLLNQGALDLSRVWYVVLDEADEMLSMGFIEDVETILAETPAERQTALFSATMPAPIVSLSERYMRDPQTVRMATKTLTVSHTEQRCYMVAEQDKLAALCRLLETEDLKSALVFTRTKVGAAQLAEALLGRGYPAEALHGDLNQDARETVLRRFRSGQLTVLVATDVVARGVDIQGVSHVFNYDMPYDAEDYVHRIGRTGRAGRTGVAITLVAPRERRWLKGIESFTRHFITRAKLPTVEQVQARRDERFRNQLDLLMVGEPLDPEIRLIADLLAAGYEPADVAAAAVRLARAAEAQRPIEPVHELPEHHEHRERPPRLMERTGGQGRRTAEAGMVRLLLSVGRSHGIQPGDIVGAIAGEAGIPGRAIGAIDIRPHETYVDVKDIHVDRVLKRMGRCTLRGQNATLRRFGEGQHDERRPHRVAKPV